MSRSPPSKRTVYLPPRMLREIRAEAKRQGRPMSALVQQALRLALPTLRKMPEPIR